MSARQSTWDLESLRRHRPRLTDLLGPEPPIIGHHDTRLQLLSHLEHADATTLFVLSGPAGSGKTALLTWVGQTAPERTVDVRQAVNRLQGPLRSDGSDSLRLLDDLRPLMAAAGPNAALVYDDVDHDLLPEGVARFVRDSLQALDMSFVVLTARTALPSEQFPLPVIALPLDRRIARDDEFSRFLDTALAAAGSAPDAFDVHVRTHLFGLEQHAPDFRALTYVVEMLLARHRETGRVIHPQDLYHLLNEDTDLKQFRSFPGVRVTDDHQLSFRRKDKTELLSDLLMRVYGSPRDLADIASDQLQGFDRRSFLDEAETSFRDAVMSMCLTQSPLELVRVLLGPRDLLMEIRALQLDRAQLFDAPEARAHLLIRGLGFTLVDAPRGVSTFRTAVASATAVVANVDARPELINGAGLSAIQQVESALLDLLHFWASYLFRSVADVVAHFNATHLGTNLRLHRLSTGDVVRLLRYIDDASDEVEKAFSLSLVGRRRPFSDALLQACDTFTQRRNAFVHDAPGTAAHAATDVIRRTCGELLGVAGEVLDRAADGSYPAVIKLTEILFDEYSRRIFSGVDSDGNDVRFAITETEGHDTLVVASHYYMLPAKRVTVNPLLVPTSGAVPPVLFERAEAYDNASHTQRRQGVRLLDLIELEPDEEILDVGCGTGSLTIDLAGRAPAGHVHGIDISPEMVRLACARVEAQTVGNVSIEIADLLDYYPDRSYDVVFSNTTMHWILPPERAYQRLFDLARPGGALAVHQGGHRCYHGLWECAAGVIEELRLGQYFSNWTYPAYYPSEDEYRTLLERIGFKDVLVRSQESDGSELPNLVRDFSNAGLLPFVNRLPETDRDYFRTEVLRRARHSRPTLYTHRLFVTARRP